MTASTDLWAGITELNLTRHDYDTAHAYYVGRVDEVFSSQRVRRALQRNGMHNRLNYAKTPVNAITDRLEIAAITSTDPDAAAAVAALWEANQLDLEAPNIHRRAAEYGDAYVIVRPVEDDRGTVIGVEMHYNSPLTVRILYSEENPRVKEYAIKRWCERTALGEVVRAELLYDDRIQRWTTKPGVAGHQETDWDHWLADPVAFDEEGTEPLPADEDSWEIPHPWGEVPVFHFRTDMPYGQPEHEAAYGCQDAVNKLIVTHLNTVDYQAFPQRYGLTEAMTTDTGDLDPGDFDEADFPPDRDLGPVDSGDDSNLKSGPGEMWLLRGYKAVGQFQPADPKVFFDPASFYIKAMAVLTETPLRRFETALIGHAPSGESLRRDEAPFVKKVRNRQLSYGATWRDVFGFCLHILGINAPVDVRWAAAASVEDAEGWNTAKLKSERGVPDRQLLLEGGYTEDQVQAWLESETDDPAELTRRLADIATFSEIAQRLGTAVTLGAIDEGQVQELLAPIMAALLGPPETAAAA